MRLYSRLCMPTVSVLGIRELMACLWEKYEVWPLSRHTGKRGSQKGNDKNAAASRGEPCWSVAARNKPESYVILKTNNMLQHKLS